MKIHQTIAATAIALATFGVSAANAATNLTYEWTYVTTSDVLGDCQGYCSDYTYLAHFNASGFLTVAAGQSPTSILSGTGTLIVSQATGPATNYDGTFDLSAVVPDTNYPGTSSNSNWIWDNTLPIDRAGGPLFQDTAGDQFNIWAYAPGLPSPTSGIPEVVTTAAAGFSLSNTSYSADFLDAKGTFTISVVPELSAAFSAVPEPATWAMLLLGFFGVGFMMRGSRRKDAVALA